MSTVEKKGASWPGIGFALGGGAGLVIGAVLMNFTTDSALWIATGVGALGGLIAGSFAAYRAQRNG